MFNRFFSKTNEPLSTMKIADDKAKEKIQSKKPSKPPKGVQNALTEVKKSIITHSKLEKIQTKRVWVQGLKLGPSSKMKLIRFKFICK